MKRFTYLSLVLSVAAMLGSWTNTRAADPKLSETIDLLAGKPEETWRTVDAGWIFSDTVVVDPMKANRLSAKPVTGGTIWVNGKTGRLKDLITKKTFGDCQVHIEFFLAKGSNSGIKFHAVYEIQIEDIYGVPDAKLKGEHCGGIYPRSVQDPNYRHIDDGIAPKLNACKKPGEWQTLDVTFRTVRLNEKGEKTSNAMIERAELNGKLIHDHQEMKTPTGANWKIKEKTAGPFMLQADHGPVAVRKLTITPIK
ncbi:MAG: DUF1080 domain-containing protein [Gemmataceae bacterium]